MTGLERYQELATAMKGKSQMEMGNEYRTYLKQDKEHVITLQLMETDIAVFYPNGDVQFFAGGWLTRLTMDRWKEYIPELQIHQSENIVRFNEVPFKEGIWLRANGFIEGGADALELKRLSNLINSYAQLFAQHLYSSLVPSEMEAHQQAIITCGLCDNPDCEATGHLLAHMRQGEEKFPYGLVDRAFETFAFVGGRYNGTVYPEGGPYAEMYKLWKEQQYKRHSVLQRKFRDLIARYLRKRLGLACSK